MTTTFDCLRAANPISPGRLDDLVEHPAFDQLREAVMRAEAAPVDERKPLMAAAQARRRARYRPRVLVAAAVAVVVGAGLWAVVLGGGARPTTRSVSWRLVGVIVRSTPRLTVSGPAPGYLTCPSSSTCFATGNVAPNDAGAANYDALYVSSDGGANWHTSALPRGFTFTTPLTCPSATSCTAGGTAGGSAVILSTTDGGDHWSLAPLAMSGELVALDCTSALDCAGLTASDATAPAIVNDGGAVGSTAIDETFVHTSDGGDTWSTSALPHDDDVTAMSCPLTGACVLVGYATDGPGQGAISLATAKQRAKNALKGQFGTPPPLQGFVLTTTDGGKTWSSGTLPSDFGFNAGSSGIACSDGAHCMAIGSINVPNTERCTGSPAQRGVAGCSLAPTATVTGVVTSSDGGRTWMRRHLPSDVPLPEMSAVTCPIADVCWLSGEDAIPQKTAKGITAGSAVLLQTLDGGADWSPTRFSVPYDAPNDVGGDAYLSAGSISCPNAVTCVALGIVDQGSTSTPVYRVASGS